MRGKNFSGFINRKSLSPELKFIVSTRATCRHKKKEKKKKISSNIQKRRFGENQSLRVRKSFEVLKKCFLRSKRYGFFILWFIFHYRGCLVEF